MSYLTNFKVIVTLTVITVFSYFGLTHAQISFEDKSTQIKVATPTSNPINEVKSGSIVYTRPDKSTFTELALDTKVDMHIAGTINRVSVKQKFTNPSNDYLEGVYVFPLPENSAVDRLKMHVGKRIIEGEIKERKQAKKIYNQAKKAGKKASLIEQQRPNIFTTNIANIAPGETITIEIEYQQTVLIDNDKFSVRFPLTIGKRYVPGKPIKTPITSTGIHKNTHRVKDAASVTPPMSDYVDRPVEININLKAGFDVDTIKSSYHQIDITDVDNITKHISLSGNNQADRDFEIIWQANKSLTPSMALFTEHKDNEHYLMLMATPPAEKAFASLNMPREVIFIIDSSGSMFGSSMMQAESALKKAINRLKPTDRFNIIDFDSGFEALFDEAMPAIDINKRHGMRFTKYLSADGGTEPLGAIKFAFNSRDEDSDNYLRQVVFLTDGQIANEEEVLKHVKLNIDEDRLFTIGIGSAPNSYLMTKLADYGKGAYTLIGNLDEVEDKMLDLFNKLESPALTNIAINFPQGINVEQATGVITDLYKGETITAVFKLNAIPNNLSIAGSMANGIFNKEIGITESNNTKGISTLWAQRKIDSLMDKYISQYRRIDRDQVQEEITNLALSHHLVSKFTSLVAVEKTPSKPNSKSTITKALANKVKAANTATNSYFWMLLGVLILLSVIVLNYRGRHE